MSDHSQIRVRSGSDQSEIGSDQDQSHLPEPPHHHTPRSPQLTPLPAGHVPLQRGILGVPLSLSRRTSFPRVLLGSELLPAGRANVH